MSICRQFFSLCCILVLANTGAQAQLFKPEIKVPNAEALSVARKMATGLFSQLEQGKTEDGQLGAKATATSASPTFLP